MVPVRMPDAKLGEVADQLAAVTYGLDTVGYVSNWRVEDGAVVGEFRRSSRTCRVFRQKAIVGLGGVENFTVQQYLERASKYRFPVRAGDTIVGFVYNFRAEGDCVVGDFQEYKQCG